MVHQEQITNLLVSVFFNAWASFLFNIFSCFIWIFFCAEQFLQPNRNWSFMWSFMRRQRTDYRIKEIVYCVLQNGKSLLLFLLLFYCWTMQKKNSLHSNILMKKKKLKSLWFAMNFARITNKSVWCLCLFSFHLSRLRFGKNFSIYRASQNYWNYRQQLIFQM